jgi:hypothetical protein
MLFFRLRRKQYTLYKTNKQNSQKLIMNSVHQIEIQDEEAITDCQKYFPHVTEVSIFFDTPGRNKHHRLIHLGNIIPLKQLTKFTLRSYQNDFSKIIDLFQCISNK